MTTETILTHRQIGEIAISVHIRDETQDFNQEFARAIEQAALQSEQVQAWKRDAELFRKMASYVYEIKRTHAQDEGTRVRRLQIDIRNHTPSPKQWLADAVDDFDAAMEKQK